MFGTTILEPAYSLSIYIYIHTHICIFIYIYTHYTYTYTYTYTYIYIYSYAGPIRKKTCWPSFFAGTWSTSMVKFAGWTVSRWMDWIRPKQNPGWLSIVRRYSNIALFKNIPAILKCPDESPALSFEILIYFRDTGFTICTPIGCISHLHPACDMAIMAVSDMAWRNPQILVVTKSPLSPAFFNGFLHDIHSQIIPLCITITKYSTTKC